MVACAMIPFQFESSFFGFEQNFKSGKFKYLETLRDFFNPRCRFASTSWKIILRGPNTLLTG